ncbi:RHS repeat-associated core domain-containing protein [Flavobacterium branchiarum]|uniref:RHS repeat domain-containing protein n=1 Tax=Flavobacterium branchiarum TaxID=1114870 RepID=UPI0025B3D67A|nr:RHS repeat-associated core domain-containing protein [Flavobacterium branchiarum]MDN3672417.1 RHS repeat-associated core domain-containing protein [Flavobacterium branchiarum]
MSQHVEYLPFGNVLFEEHSSSFSNPYLFNGKELDRETDMSYYGARFLDMKTSLWLSVDPLAEKMPNHGAYVFSFNNPIGFIDPDGKEPIDPPNIKGISSVFNVMSNRKWINYNNNITRTRTFLGFEISRTSKHEQCADYSRLQVEQGANGNYTAEGSKNRIDMYLKNGGDNSKLDLQKGINVIVKNLKEGKAVMAGIMYDSKKETGNPNTATNHYVTIVGMGTDDKGVYFSYYDNYSSGKGERVGTDLTKNKFRLVKGSNNSYYFGDIDNNIPLNGNENRPVDNKEGKPARYILTEVRDNN